MAKDTPIIKDWMLYGAGIGAVLSLTGESLNVLMCKANLPSIRYASMASGIVLGKRALFGMIPSGPSNKAEWAIGWAGHVAVGTLFSIGLSYIYSKTPPGKETYKGIIGGLLWWVSTIAVEHQLRLASLAKVKPVNLAANLGMTMVFGAIQGSLIGKYGAKAVTQSHPVAVTNMDMKQFDKNRMTVSQPAETSFPQEVKPHL